MVWQMSLDRTRIGSEAVEPAKTLDGLVERLGQSELHSRAKAFFDVRLTREQAICVSVDGSTFRAYRAAMYTPSSLFRSWALGLVNSSDWLERLTGAAESDDHYGRLHTCLNSRLEAYWRDKDGSELSFAQSRKLIDLLMKHVMLIADDAFTKELREKLRHRLNVPLDKYTLRHLRVVATEIPENATMGWINEERYQRLQDRIRDVTEDASVAPIIFDIYAWNAGRDEMYAEKCKLRMRSG